MDLTKVYGIFSILLLRYLVIAGLAFVIFYILLKKRKSHQKIQLRFPGLSDYQREIIYSVITTVIFTLIGVLILSPNLLRPYTLIYSDVGTYGVGYIFISFFLIIITHDTYFYWTHRAMHSKFGMKYIHLVHHKSTNPSPWAAFSFHPYEAIVEAGILLVVVFLFPVHIFSILMFMIFMTFYNVYGHLGWELYPRNFHRSIIGKWINTSVNHNQHHKKFDGNYGLYFLFWDRIMGTIREDYDTTFEEVTCREAKQLS